MNIDLLPPLNDYVFVSLFGKKSHERVLVCSLNAILNSKPHIKSVKLEHTEYKKRRWTENLFAWMLLRHQMMVLSETLKFSTNTTETSKTEHYFTKQG